MIYLYCCNFYMITLFTLNFVNRIAEGTPNARTCLLHQKLQLLNCCIKRTLEGTGSIAGNSSDDEFYDCSDGENEDQLPSDRPVGRLQRLADATLKNGAPLYVPRTQVILSRFSEFWLHVTFSFQVIKNL